MAHDKMFGICENKCLVEVSPKTDTDAVKTRVGALETHVDNIENGTTVLPVTVDNNIDANKMLTTTVNGVSSQPLDLNSAIPGTSTILISNTVWRMSLNTMMGLYSQAYTGISNTDPAYMGVSTNVFSKTLNAYSLNGRLYFTQIPDSWRITVSTKPYSRIYLVNSNEVNQHICSKLASTVSVFGIDYMQIKLNFYPTKDASSEYINTVYSNEAIFQYDSATQTWSAVSPPEYYYLLNSGVGDGTDGTTTYSVIGMDTIAVSSISVVTFTRP